VKSILLLTFVSRKGNLGFNSLEKSEIGEVMAEQKKVLMPSASFIVARSFPGNVIGCENKLPWRLRTDLKRFRDLTTGHAIIMGRKTLESIGKPLPNRTNIVISRTPPEEVKGVSWVKTVEDAVYLADFVSICQGKEEFFVIGGDQIYKTFQEKDLCNRVLLTEVYCGDIKGDAFFNYQFDLRSWNVDQEIDVRKSDDDEFPFRFVAYSRKSKTLRTRLRSEFFTDLEEAAAWKARYAEVIDKWQAAHPLPIEYGPSFKNRQLELVA
jgi:dihydrofolate reductase